MGSVTEARVHQFWLVWLTHLPRRSLVLVPQVLEAAAVSAWPAHRFWASGHQPSRFCSKCLPLQILQPFFPAILF